VVKLGCPGCGDRFVWRSPPRGLADRLLRPLGIDAFECPRCERRFRRWAPYLRGRGRERRQYERLAAKVVIGIRWEGESAPGTATDVSLGGAGVESELSVPEGMMLEVEFRPGEAGTEVGVNHAIVRSAREGRLGLEFVPLTDEERRRIGRLVRQLLREGQG
jgi:hypothetical protein